VAGGCHAASLIFKTVADPKYSSCSWDQPFSA
jgi:hypothetical protein